MLKFNIFYLWGVFVLSVQFGAVQYRDPGGGYSLSGYRRGQLHCVGRGSDHRDYAEQDFGPGRLSSVFRKQKGAAAVQGVLGTVGLCLFFFFGSAILSSSDRKALNFCFIPTEEKALEAVKSRTALQGGVFSGNGSFPVSPCFSLLG